MNIEHEIYEHELDLPLRKEILTKQRIVVKIGSSSLMHPETGRLDLNRMEVLVRELCNIRNSGKEVVLALPFYLRPNEQRQGSSSRKLRCDRCRQKRGSCCQSE